MSADNGIYILGTVLNRKIALSEDKHKIISWHETCPSYDVYRVAAVSGFDNFYYYEDMEHHNVGAYLYTNFNKSKIFLSLEKALEEANKLYKEERQNIGYVEYGIQEIKTDYKFFGD